MAEDHRKEGRTKGFTLMEVMIGCFILVLVAFAVVQAMNSAKYLGIKDRIITHASYSGQMVLESIIRDTKDATSFNALASRPYSDLEDVNRLIYDVSVTDVKPDMKKVTVHVFHKAKDTVAPDTGRLNGGKILQYSCYIIKP